MERDNTRTKWLVIAVLLSMTVGSIYCFFDQFNVWTKAQWKILGYKPVDAFVLKKDDTNCIYTYKIGSQKYLSATLLPYPADGTITHSTNYASGIIVQQRYTAFYNPDHPADAFLVKANPARPWIFLPMIIIPIILAFLAMRLPTN